MFDIAICDVKAGSRRRTLPYVSTERGVAMLSTVLNSERRAAMEKKYDQRFKVVFDTLKRLMEAAPEPRKRPIGIVGPGKE